MRLPDDLAPLDKLREDIGRIRHKTPPAKAISGPVTGAFAMRTGLELVSGVVVGAGIGILLDRWLGTLPLFLIVGFFLGTAAGSLNLYRLAAGRTKTKNDTNTVHKEVTKSD